MVFDASLLSIAQKPRPQSQFATGPMLQDEWIQFVALGLGQMIELPEVLAWHRIHETSVTREEKGHYLKYNVKRSCTPQTTSMPSGRARGELRRMVARARLP